MEIEVLKSSVVWIKKKCKEQKILVDKAEEKYKCAKLEWGYFDDTRCFVDDAYLEFRLAQERLKAYVDIKISMEKYIKKLKYQGQIKE